jgi:hypothetical protein
MGFQESNGNHHYQQPKTWLCDMMSWPMADLSSFHQNLGFGSAGYSQKLLARLSTWPLFGYVFHQHHITRGRILSNIFTNIKKHVSLPNKPHSP